MHINEENYILYKSLTSVAVLECIPQIYINFTECLLYIDFQKIDSS